MVVEWLGATISHMNCRLRILIAIWLNYFMTFAVRTLLGWLCNTEVLGLSILECSLAQVCVYLVSFHWSHAIMLCLDCENVELILAEDESGRISTGWARVTDRLATRSSSKSHKLCGARPFKLATPRSDSDNCGRAHPSSGKHHLDHLIQRNLHHLWEFRKRI
jgi:hypothetical protein